MALRSTQPLTEMSARSFSWGKGGRCVRLTTYHHPVPLSRNLGTLTSWKPLGHSRPVTGLIYLCLDMFRATMCPSSGETTVFIGTWYLLFCVDHCLVCRVEWKKYKYSCFSWWWAHSRPKHVEKRNRHTKKNFALIWLYLQDCVWMHSQQNIKLHQVIFPEKNVHIRNDSF